ncbi:Zinc Finger Protein With Krab And Scan Domains 1 [Manis pentadactyla]|nr:Zinc Finger Protein With Krab And Scan Domains 1 [Manis pentadactyla]
MYSYSRVLFESNGKFLRTPLARRSLTSEFTVPPIIPDGHGNLNFALCCMRNSYLIRNKFLDKNLKLDTYAM